MIIVRVTKHEGSKTIIEDLDINSRQGGHDEIVLAHCDFGEDVERVLVTQKDIDRLFWEKKAECVKRTEERQAEKEKRSIEALKELEQWKMEMKGKNFIQQIFVLWKMRKKEVIPWQS